MSNFTELNLDSITVGRAIRYAGIQNGFQFNKTQINKLLYIAYGMLLVRRKERLTAEHPAAWPYGPVFPRMNTKIKLSDPIADKEYNALPDTVRSLIDEVVKKYGHFNARTLSNWSHKDGSPWAKAEDRAEGKWNEKLDDEDIFNYFFNFFSMEII